MDYPFVCEICGKAEIISMPIKEYTSDHICKECGGKMVRPISSLVCGYKNPTDGFFGKATQHD